MIGDEPAALCFDIGVVSRADREHAIVREGVGADHGLFLDITDVPQQKTPARIIKLRDIHDHCGVVVIARAFLEIAFPPKATTACRARGLDIQGLTDFLHNRILAVERFDHEV